MSYRLKDGQPPFEVVDGDLIGRRYEPGREYAEIPAREKERFVRVRRRSAAGKGEKK